MNRPGTSNSSFGERVDPSTVTECVRYIISREGSKIPIKLADIKKHLEDQFGVSRNTIKNIICDANNVLKRVYGYKLVQVDAKQSQYILILNGPNNYSMVSTYINPQHRKLLIAALTHIFMTGAPVKEDDMWRFLIAAQLIKESDLEKKKLLTKIFTRQMYLKYVKDTDGLFYFDWGQRAEEEIPKIFLLNKMGEAFNVSPEYWSDQYRKATANENEEDNNDT